MAKVLIVDDDLGLQHLLNVTLRKFKNSFEIAFAGNGKEALDRLEKDKYHLLVTDIKMPEMDGLSLLSRVSVKFPSLPCIVLTSYTIPGLEQKLSSSILHFHKKPVNPDELGESIIQGIKQAEQQGELGGVSLTGLIQIIEAEQKTCHLNVNKQADEVGKLFFLEGALIHAVSRDLSGENAATYLMGLDNVQTTYRPGLPQPTPKKTIQVGLQGLILEAMRIKDEQQAEPENVEQRHQKLLKQGIHLCEGLQFVAAQKPLLTLLQQNGNHIEAWLWLSRCVSSLKKTKIILKKLYQLAPTDERVAQEIRKFHTASGQCRESIIHCPFCYAPLDPQAARCSHCRSYIVVNEDIFPQIGKSASKKDLKKAILRFETVLTRELNIRVLFYSGMAHLNLDNAEQALQYFEQLQECIGSSDSFYTKTVQRILSFIASRSQEDEDNVMQCDSETTIASDNRLSSAPKILVVEDSPTTRKVIKMTLEANRYTVVEAGDGVEALTKLNDERPDLVLLDVMLPNLDGYGILSLLKKNENFKKVPVIMLTSKDRLRDKIKGRFSAASAYLTKPFEPQKLLDEVAKYLPAS